MDDALIIRQLSDFFYEEHQLRPKRCVGELTKRASASSFEPPRFSSISAGIC